jgi:hypothetical protein
VRAHVAQVGAQPVVAQPVPQQVCQWQWQRWEVEAGRAVTAPWSSGPAEDTSRRKNAYTQSRKTQ